MHGDKFYVPINLEGTWSDRQLYIIDTLYTTRFTDKRYSALTHFQKQARKREFMPLSSLYLKSVLGRNYKKIIESLIHSYVSRCDNSYTAGVKCKSYALTSQYRDKPFRTLPIQDLKFKQHLDALKDKKYQSLSPLHKDMFKVMQNDFTFDCESAEKYFESNFSNENGIAFQLNALKEHEYYFSTDSNTGRVFTNYTNLKREFRKFIHHASGERLVELDIKNSQPLFLASLYNQFSHSSNSLYSNLCEQGIIYDYMQAKIGGSRDKVKTGFLTVLFSPKHWDSKVKRVFQSDFPELLDYANHVKENRSNELALALQKCEADIVLNTVGSQLLQENISFLSVHDSLIVTQSQSEYVKNLMARKISEQYNINPIITMKGGN